MNMKKRILTAVLAAVPLVSANASIPVGRGEITLGASASGTYDSNIRGRNGSSDDYYGTFAPRISYLRHAGKIEADASVSVSVLRYQDNTQFNSENVSGDVSLRIAQKSNLSGSLTAAYNEGYVVDIDVNDRIKSASTTVSADGGLTTGPRTSLSFGGSYAKSDRVGASDQETFTGEAGFNYHGFLDDTTLSLSYSYTVATSSGQNLVGADLDQRSHSFSVSLSRALYRDVKGQLTYGYRMLDRSAAETASGQTQQNGGFVTASIDGPFLPRRMFPKIKSHASISYQDAQTPGVRDDGSKQVSGDIGLTWDARTNTSVSLNGGRSQRLSSTDLTVVSSNVRASVNQKIRHNLSGSVGAGYNSETYRGISRKDEVMSYDGSLSYSFARSWNSSVSYTYTSSSSNVATSDFMRHLATLTVAYTY